jgi:hypothetical protein
LPPRAAAKGGAGIPELQGRLAINRLPQSLQDWFVAHQERYEAADVEQRGAAGWNSNDSSFIGAKNHMQTVVGSSGGSTTRRRRRRVHYYEGIVAQTGEPRALVVTHAAVFDLGRFPPRSVSNPVYLVVRIPFSIFSASLFPHFAPEWARGRGLLWAASRAGADKFAALFARALKIGVAPSAPAVAAAAATGAVKAPTTLKPRGRRSGWAHQTGGYILPGGSSARAGNTSTV